MCVGDNARAEINMEFKLITIVRLQFCHCATSIGTPNSTGLPLHPLDKEKSKGTLLVALPNEMGVQAGMHSIGMARMNTRIELMFPVSICLPLIHASILPPST